MHGVWKSLKKVSSPELFQDLVLLSNFRPLCEEQVCSNNQGNGCLRVSSLYHDASSSHSSIMMDASQRAAQQCNSQILEQGLAAGLFCASHHLIRKGVYREMKKKSQVCLSDHQTLLLAHQTVDEIVQITFCAKYRKEKGKFGGYYEHSTVAQVCSVDGAAKFFLVLRYCRKLASCQKRSFFSRILQHADVVLYALQLPHYSLPFLQWPFQKCTTNSGENTKYFCVSLSFRW